LYSKSPNVETERREVEVTKVNKLEGVYLDSEFRRINIYVCERSSSPHKFDIPLDISQQTKREKEWLKDIQKGKCPLC
jgi:hypothetical protein